MKPMPVMGCMQAFNVSFLTESSWGNKIILRKKADVAGLAKELRTEEEPK